MAKVEKMYQVKKTRNGRETIFEGTLSLLIDGVFGYTLECGNSWNKKIPRHPKTIKSLIKAINDSYDETEGGYIRSYVELAD